MLGSMAVLYEENLDIAGWLNIEGTVIDYPVMYTPEDGENISTQISRETLMQMA